MLLTAMNGCKKAAEKTNEKLIEESIGGDAKVDIDDQKVVIETDEGTFTTDANVAQLAHRYSQCSSGIQGRQGHGRNNTDHGRHE